MHKNNIINRVIKESSFWISKKDDKLILEIDQLAKGSSRIVYPLLGNSVIKIALNSKGIEQNRVEVEVNSNSLTTIIQANSILSKLYRNHSKYKWIVVEKCNKISETEFYDYFKISYDNFFDFINYNFNKQKYKKPFNYERILNLPFIKILLKLASTYDLYLPEFRKLNSWGKTSNGNIVLIDYGTTNKIWNNLYKDKK